MPERIETISTADDGTIATTIKENPNGFLLRAYEAAKVLGLTPAALRKISQPDTVAMVKTPNGTETVFSPRYSDDAILRLAETTKRAEILFQNDRYAMIVYGSTTTTLRLRSNNLPQL